MRRVGVQVHIGLVPHGLLTHRSLRARYLLARHESEEAQDDVFRRRCSKDGIAGAGTLYTYYREHTVLKDDQQLGTST